MQQFVPPVIDDKRSSMKREKDEESESSRHDMESFSVAKNDRSRFNFSRQDLELLKELDETVASIGMLHESPTPLVHDDSERLSSKTDAHLDGRSCFLHQRVVDRMHYASNSGYSQFASGTSQTWVSNRKRKRRDCLEQVVASTIMRGEAKCVEFQKDSSGRQQESVCCGAEYILQDLRQACEILKCEIEAHHWQYPDDKLRVHNFEPQDLLVLSLSAPSNDDSSTNDDTRDECPDQGNDSRMSWSNVDDAEDNDDDSALFANDSSDLVIATVKQPYVEMGYVQDTGGQVNTIGFLQRRGSLDGEEWTTFTNNPFDATSHSAVQGVKCHFTVVRPWKTSELGWKQIPRSTVPVRASC
jgi:hypothetical protein